MHVDWQTLGGIAVVSAAAALTLVLLVALALVASSGRPDQRAADPGGDGAAGPRTAGGTTVATLCLSAAGLLVAYGVYLIVA